MGSLCHKEAMMRTRTFAVLATLAILGCGTAGAQTPANPDRKETARERDNTERRPDPGERNNTDRIDPLLSAELQKCYVLPESEKDRCVTEAKRKFGLM
jgi:hypothetical protein